MIAGMAGGAVVCALALDISPTLFIAMVQENIGISHFILGMVKAPIFAFLIAAIGCNEGFRVSGSAQSVGDHTTSSVVKSNQLSGQITVTVAQVYPNGTMMVSGQKPMKMNRGGEY